MISPNCGSNPISEVFHSALHPISNKVTTIIYFIYPPIKALITILVTMYLNPNKTTDNDIITIASKMILLVVMTIPPVKGYQAINSLLEPTISDRFR